MVFLFLILKLLLQITHYFAEWELSERILFIRSQVKILYILVFYETLNCLNLIALIPNLTLTMFFIAFSLEAWYLVDCVVVSIAILLGELIFSYSS